jgi:hypothetical protein
VHRSASKTIFTTRKYIRASTVALGHLGGHGVVRRPDQLRVVAESGQIDCFECLHDLLARLHVLLPVEWCG